mgnify:CR=1 FL=1
MPTLRFDPRSLIGPPFGTCPACGKPEFGLLDVHRHSYTKRCRNCMNTETFRLPTLQKTVLYLDQFAISNMMKAINQYTKANRLGRVDPFWAELFDRLDSLVKLQVLVCADSVMHQEESALAPYYGALRRMYEQLSHGVSFDAPETIKRFQLVDHASWWITGAEGEFVPDLDRNSILSEPIDGWQDRFILTVEFPFDQEWIDQLRESRNKTSRELEHLFSEWQKDTEKTFDDWYWAEIRAFAEATLQQYFLYLRRFAQYRRGQDPADLIPTPSFLLVREIQDAFVQAGIPRERLHEKTLEYFRSETLASIPFLRIAALLWASIAREAARGRRKPPTRGTVTDIEMISALLPYCDAMFVDRECAGHLRNEPVKSRVGYPTRIFSLANKSEFLAYLDDLHNQIPRDHLATVRDVYGPDWPKPFSEMYET